jgi:hypothetical protein
MGEEVLESAYNGNGSSKEIPKNVGDKINWQNTVALFVVSL